MPAGDLITQDGQLEWRNTLLGVGTAYKLVGLEGWKDLPEARDNDLELDNEHGSQPGQLLGGRRTITYTFQLSQELPAFRAAVTELERITAWGENPAEEDLVIQLDGIKALVRARCIRRNIPTDKHYALGFTRGAVQWRATNPRKLRLPQQTPQTTPPVSGTGGLIFPLVFPLVFGSAQSGGELLLANSGNAHVQPVWRITGPCTGPVITNADTGQQIKFSSSYVLPSGQRLTLSTEDRSVLLDSGVSRSNQVVTRGWFTLPPDATTRVRFTSADGLGTLECLYYSTSL